MTGKEIKKWADDFMFEAQEIPPNQDMEIFLIHCNNDPLGSIAWAAKAYKGEFVRSLAEITDDERRHYLAEIQKTALAMPLEAVTFGFRLSAVTRGFTHQMVRQRTAAYSQESTRFAVKSGVPVGLPPSLSGTEPGGGFERLRKEYVDQFNDDSFEADKWAEKYMSEKDNWRWIWDHTVEMIASAYNRLVDAGMPAEDARGLLPTNLLTQINYITNLRNFKAEAGKRLCTQAQFEWRLAWAKFAEAIRNYGKTQTYLVGGNDPYGDSKSSQWQFDAIADLFRPVCYYTGKCEFGAEFDRKCSIRGRVEANHQINRPSTEWHEELDNVSLEDPNAILSGFNGTQIVRTELGMPVFIPSIRPEEWLLDPGAAR